MYYYYNLYVIKKIVELASKSASLWFKAPKVSIEIKRIQVGMLGEQGGNSR